MALLRNIAGVPQFSEVPSDQVGLVIYPGRDTLYNPIVQTGVPLPTGGRSIEDVKNTLDQLHAASDDIQRQQEVFYDQLLNTSLYDLAGQGYFVDPDGSIGQGNSYVLVIMDIQRIENARGTAGTLLMHFGKPIIAKDTAGYAGGSSHSSGSTTMYSTPIAEVQALPWPTGGPNVINDYTPPTVESTYPDVPSTIPNTTPPVNTVPTPTTTAKSDMMPLLVVAGLVGLLLLSRRKH